jgi:cyclopropane fatty-acyl-phospholipid synthase-like methyltransferase
MSSYAHNTVMTFAQAKAEYDMQAPGWELNFAWAADDLESVVKPKLQVEQGDAVLDLGFGNGDAIKYAIQRGAGFVMGFEASLELTKRYLLPWLSSKYGPISLSDASLNLTYIYDTAYHVAIADMTDSQAVMTHLQEVVRLNGLTNPPNPRVSEMVQQMSHAGEPTVPGVKFNRIFILNAFQHVAHNRRAPWLDFLKRHVLLPGGTITITVPDPEGSMQALEIVTAWFSASRGKVLGVTRR